LISSGSPNKICFHDEDELFLLLRETGIMH